MFGNRVSGRNIVIFIICTFSLVLTNAQNDVINLSSKSEEKRRRLTDNKFEVNSGSCMTSGDCFQSPNYPSEYANSQTCTIKVLSVGEGEKLYSMAFITNSYGGDKLTIGGTVYSYTTGPNNVVVSPNDEFSISWSIWVSILYQTL